MVGQSSFMNLNTYCANYGFKPGAIDSNSPTITSAPKATVAAFAGLTGDPTRIDDPLELALFLYYGHINITDASAKAKAETELPHNNQQLASIKLGAEVLRAMTALDKTADTTSYEKILKSICNHNKITKADIQKFYDQALLNTAKVSTSTDSKKTPTIAAPVTAAVPKTTIVTPTLVSTKPATNTVSFVLEELNFTASLQKTADNGYIMKYAKRPSLSGEILSGTITAISLKELLASLNRDPHFNNASVEEIRSQARLLDTVVKK